MSLLWIALAVYVGVMLAIGFWMSRRVRDTEDYIVAGRKMPLWICTFTLLATWFGPALCIGAAGEAYSGGLLAVVAEPYGGALCLFLCGFFFFGVVRRLKLLTIADYFRRRYGRHAEILAALGLIPIYIAWVSGMLVAFGIVLHEFAGIDTVPAILLGTAIVVVYTISGGMWAVSLTDVVQSAFLILGVVVLFPMILNEAGGWSAVWNELPATHFEFLPENSTKGWLWYVQAWVVIGIGAIPGQELLQRASAARDEWTATRSAILAGIAYLVIGSLVVCAGMAGRLIISDLERSDLILPVLAAEHLPPVALALFVGALFSAFMSSADSGLLAVASVISVNLIQPLRRNVAGQTTLRDTRAGVVVIAAMSAVIAVYFQAAYHAILFSGSIGLVALVVPFAAGLFWKKATRRAALASMYTGLGSWIMLSSVQDAYPADLIAAFLGVVALVVVTVSTRKNVTLPGSSGA